MQDYLGAVGLLFFMFFLVAAATEAVLESFRGVLERFGLIFLRSGYSLDDAIKMSTEFLPAGTEARGKVVALQKFVGDASAWAAKTRKTLVILKSELDDLAASDPIDQAFVQAVNGIEMRAREILDANERRRIFVLRILSIGIAITLCGAVNIDAVRSMIQAYPSLFGGLSIYKIELINGLTSVTPLGFTAKYLGIAITGIAAASGSSYWHDQLDKVRNLKGLTDQMANFPR